MDYPATFVSTLLHSATNAHFQHLMTDSYACHVALGEYYDEIVELTDKYAESYQGAYEVIKSYPKDFHLANDPVKYMKSLKAFVKEIRSELPKDTELNNIIDEIAQLIDSTLYKLRFLK
jgi:DNA-binding ferritin-like protein